LLVVEQMNNVHYHLYDRRSVAVVDRVCQHSRLFSLLRDYVDLDCYEVLMIEIVAVAVAD
jgi:hypothetical protein